MPKGAKNLLAVILLLVIFSGCGLMVNARGPEHSHAAGVTGQSGGGIKGELYSQYAEWKGVRYRYGGLSKSGIDCSGFVYMTFRSRFGVKLPRTTTRMSELGAPVGRSGLKAGDLVFFKTGPRVKHVGIYLERGAFLHASKNRGVIISKLSEEYWKARYWQARRVEGI